MSRHDDIQALEWIPRVLHPERDRYETELKPEFPAFQFTERQEQGRMVKAEERQEYFPVYYVEPFTGNEAALGFDLASNDSRRETLEKSRDLGYPKATASITLVQEKEAQKGFLAFLPIYKGSPNTQQQRRDQLIGFVLGVYRIGDIFLSSALTPEPPDIEMKLFDETATPGSDLLYIRQARTGLPIHDDVSYKKQLPEIWGRQWSISASPTLAYISTRRSSLPVVIFASGFLFAIAIAVYISIISNRSAIIKKLVIEKT
ncbi:MAG: CHASE domain-containing protein, partial [Gammaproteobacteria bacterium]